MSSFCFFYDCIYVYWLYSGQRIRVDSEIWKSFSKGCKISMKEKAVAQEQGWAPLPKANV